MITTKETDDSDTGHSEIGAPQKMFIVTDKGETILKETVIEYFQRSNLNYKEMNLALASAYVFEEKELLDILYYQKTLLEDRISVVRRRYTEDQSELSESDLPVHVWGLYKYAFGMLKARKKFLNEMILKIEET